jgi:PIN domain nuclease of toxin-antitoxin system
VTLEGYQLDASALLAVMLNEPGHERVSAVLNSASIHAVNVAEVIAKLMRAGVPLEEARESVDEIHLKIGEEFSLGQAAACGALIAETRKQGLSLGDCICLTSAALADRVAVTAERRWKELEGRQCGGVALRVELIR